MRPFTLLIAVLIAAALPAQDTKSKTVRLVYEMPVS